MPRAQCRWVGLVVSGAREELPQSEIVKGVHLEVDEPASHMISHLFFSFSLLICDRDFLRSSSSDMTRVLSSDKSSCSGRVGLRWSTSPG